MASKEDIEVLVSSDFWIEVRDEMDEKRQDLVDTLTNVDFTREGAVLSAIKVQADINAIDSLLDSIANVQDNAE